MFHKVYKTPPQAPPQMLCKIVRLVRKLTTVRSTHSTLAHSLIR